MPKLSNLISPGRIGAMELHNRMVMSAMGLSLSNDEGFASEEEICFLEERAKGGVGLIITGAMTISYPDGVCIIGQMGLSDDKFIAGLTELTARIHKYGAKVAAQIQHPGAIAAISKQKGMSVLTPSLPEHTSGDIGTLHEFTDEEIAIFLAKIAPPNYQIMTKQDIRSLIAKFAEAAERARRCGFDAVEIHGGHGYLIDRFLNSAYNKRDDEYGGSLENRSRLLVEIIHASKERAGQDFPVICKLDAVTMHEAAGISSADAIGIAGSAENAGADAIFCTAYGGMAKSTAMTDSHTPAEPNIIVPHARRIKATVNIPVIGVGRIEPNDGNRLIGEGAIDFVAMGRQLLADPALPNKVREDRIDDILPCITCFTCISSVVMGTPITCSLNPACGREGEFEVKEAARTKRVLVVGGGPAGMEAARVAALRGHTVTLCEKEKFLGGTLFFASILDLPKYKFVKYLEHQLRQLKVDIRLGVEVTPEYVHNFKPNAVVVGVGIRRFLPDIPGVDQNHVLSGDDIRKVILASGDRGGSKIDLKTKLVLKAGSLTGITRNPEKLARGSKAFMPLGKNIVIIGGGLVGVEMAGFFRERRRNVTILEEGNSLGWEIPLLRRWLHLKANQDNGVKSLVKCKVLAIDKKTVTYIDGNSEKHTIDADHVIIAQGDAHNLELADSLGNYGYEFYTVGDCSGDALIKGAMSDGLTVGRTL